MFTLSIVFYILGTLSCGYVLLSALDCDHPGIGESFLTGASSLALGVFVVVLFFDWPVRLVCLVLLISAVLTLPCYLLIHPSKRPEFLKNEIFDSIMPLLFLYFSSLL